MTAIRVLGKDPVSSERMGSGKGDQVLDDLFLKP